MSFLLHVLCVLSASLHGCAVRQRCITDFQRNNQVISQSSPNGFFQIIAASKKKHQTSAIASRLLKRQPGRQRNRRNWCLDRLYEEDSNCPAVEECRHTMNVVVIVLENDDDPRRLHGVDDDDNDDGSEWTKRTADGNVNDLHHLVLGVAKWLS